jgi:hypothetical protein
MQPSNELSSQTSSKQIPHCIAGIFGDSGLFTYPVEEGDFFLLDTRLTLLGDPNLNVSGASLVLGYEVTKLGSSVCGYSLTPF